MNRQLSNKEVANLMFALESVAQDSEELSQGSIDEQLKLRDVLETGDVWITPRD
jgi:hypothetical protein